MSRQKDNHISVAWVPLWWGIILLWFCTEKQTPNKATSAWGWPPVQHNMGQGIFCALQLHPEHKEGVRYSAVYTQTSLIWWCLKRQILTHTAVHFGYFRYSTERKEERRHCFPTLCMNTSTTDCTGMTNKPNCCQKCSSWILKNVSNKIYFSQPPLVLHILW